MKEEVLTVRLFGGFSVRYGDAVLPFGKQANSKFGQLFQILMTRPGKGVSKQVIMDAIYGRGEVEDVNASFNNTMSRLRKYLEKSPLPPGEYLIGGGGLVRFDGPVRVKSDAWDFEQAAEEFEQEADAGKRAKLCEKACTLYGGDFLPQLSNEPWVIRRNHYYQSRYFKMLRCLLEYLKEAGDYVAIGQMSLRAMEIEPLGEWLFWRVDSLIAQSRYQDAWHAYRRAAEQMQNLGASASRKLLDQFQALGKRLQEPDGTKEGIYQNLRETEPWQGAYFCTLPGFVDMFRILKRRAKRKRIPYVLLLLMVQRAGGGVTDSEKNGGNQGERLREAFRLLRSGDVYTKYNENQYLLLCLDTEEQHVPEIAMRISDAFRKSCRGRYTLYYQVLDNGDNR